MKKFLACVMAFTLLLSAAACSGGRTGGEKTPQGGNSSGGSPVKVKISMSVPKDHESYLRVQEFTEKVNADCGNAFAFELYPSDSLGDWTLVSEEIVRGNVEMLVSSYEANDIRADFIWAPYLATDAGEIQSRFAVDGYIYNTIKDIYAESGAVFLGFDFIGMCGLSFGSKAPASPAAIGGGEGLMVRIAGEEHIRQLMLGMGYNPTTVPWSEVYSSVQTGVIDGFNGAVPSVAYQQFRDVISTYVVCNILTEVQPICVSQKFWDTLTEEQQTSFRTHAAELFEKSIEETMASEEDYLAQLEASGVTVIRATDEEIQALADYTRTECWPCLEEMLGEDLYQGLLSFYDLA